MTTTVAGDSPYTYTPVEHILLNCGSSDNSTASKARIWIGDVNSKFLIHEQSQSQSSLTTSAVKQARTVPRVPFTDARLSLAPFTYVFPVTAGQKFVRLHFHPASYSNFNRANALFSVKVGDFTVLRNFNASLNADADSKDTISREYCVNIEEGQRLNITFTPSLSVSNSYAFINGIEILSMPNNLYFTPVDDQGFDFIGLQNWSRVDNSTYLEMNTAKPRYTAPQGVYRTARTLGNDSTVNLSYNLTWEFPVDSGFHYLIRLHFCEFQPEIIYPGDRTFRIFIANHTVEKEADVISWSGGNGVPVYKDYPVSMLGDGTEKKVNLNVAIGAEPQQWKTSYVDAILNGVEIFKISDFNGNPDPLPPDPPTIAPPGQSKNSKGNRTKIISVAADGVAGFIVLSC
ncbi:receptor-like protein kinase FERONIA [Juglans microcarpa x Juglans regia]|uniref:receptor-like protein kinase FERONIA n=1 Tax=Juglans microcarpa x Juglans regia TaxID=2249226 RepID=UPI001B7EC96C|nr:receptor-like protein kinase FERONIA [Juglans microcarpa x Juglans regia]